MPAEENNLQLNLDLEPTRDLEFPTLTEFEMCQKWGKEKPCGNIRIYSRRPRNRVPLRKTPDPYLKATASLKCLGQHEKRNMTKGTLFMSTS